MVALRLEAVGAQYGRHRVFADITTGDITGGVLTAVIGPNAAGKSTLFKRIAGLLKDEPERIQAQALQVGEAVEHLQTLGLGVQVGDLVIDQQHAARLDLIAGLGVAAVGNGVVGFQRLDGGRGRLGGRLRCGCNGGGRQSSGCGCFWCS